MAFDVFATDFTFMALTHNTFYFQDRVIIFFCSIANVENWRIMHIVNVAGRGLPDRAESVPVGDLPYSRQRWVFVGLKERYWLGRKALSECHIGVSKETPLIQYSTCSRHCFA